MSNPREGPSSASANPPSSSSSSPASSFTSTSSASSSSQSSSTGTASSSAARPAQEPLTGFRASLQYTGLPRSVITWKPRLPSRNWSIFFGVVGTVTYLYYSDRKECERIKEEYISKVKDLAMEPMESSLDVPRKVRVIGARWPEDDDEDRALRYFRKYVKPYLVAAAIDYEQMDAPIPGSITRQVHRAILSRRRQQLGLEPVPQNLSLPHLLNAEQLAQKELEGGTVVVGRPSMKEYMEGVRRGWTRGVDEWDWEKEIEDKLQYDGIFESKPEEVTFVPDPNQAGETADQSQTQSPSTSTSPSPSASLSGLSFLSRLRPAAPVFPPPGMTSENGIKPGIPSSYHIPPSPLPPQPPILLVPFVSRLGFKQFPWMIYDFFTERYKVQSGAECALALITNQTRPLSGPSAPSSSIPDFLSDSTPLAESPAVQSSSSDLEFDKDKEEWFKKSYFEVPSSIAKNREEYYAKLKTRIQEVRDLADGKRELTEEEKKSSAPLTTEADLKAERKKKELRWMGTEEGFEIVNPASDVAWDDRFTGWLKVFELPAEERKSQSS